MIANAIVSGKYNEDQPCLEGDAVGEDSPCYRAVANLEIFLKGKEKVIDIQNLIINVLSDDTD